VKRFYADDSAATSVKVGYCQASYKRKTPEQRCTGVFFRPQICRLQISRMADWPLNVGRMKSAIFECRVTAREIGTPNMADWHPPYGPRPTEVS
jgi:hypothetical protein